MSESAPSRVVHFGNVGNDVTKQDLVSLTQPWGAASNVLLLKNNQALVQFNDLPAAVNFVQYYKNFSIQLKGRAVYVRFSNHQTLSKGQVDAEGTSPSPMMPSSLDEKHSRVLLVTILNQHYIITIDIMHSVFAKFGVIEKIVLFSKTAGLQALVQFRTEQEAASAKLALNGTSLYQNAFMDACTLSIQFSNLNDITVHQNTDRSRDYSNPSLPESSMAVPLMLFDTQPQLQPSAPFPAAAAAAAYGSYAAPLFPHMPRGLEPDKCVLLVSNLNVERMDCDKIFNLFSCYGYVSKVKIFQKKRDNALVQMGDSQQATAAMNNLKGLEIFGAKLGVNFSKHAFITSTASNEAGGAPSTSIAGAASVVAIDDNLTKDYTKNSLNRYPSRPAPNKKPKSMCAPSSVLHISNLGAGLTDVALEEMFGRFGELQGVKSYDHGEKRMGLVKFAATTAASEALASLHNTPFSGRQMRIAFSMNNMI